MKYPYNYKEFENLLEEYNKLYAHKYNKTLTKEDFETDVDEIRKERIEDLLYDINNYLYSIEPYEAVNL